METRQGDMCTALTLIFSIEMNRGKRLFSATLAEAMASAATTCKGKCKVWTLGVTHGGEWT
jgi:hypothetical protein